MTLPNFLVCGAPKSGTTALYYLLKEHPDIFMSSVKETDFFQHNYVKGLDWFESFFKDYAGQKAIGEVSPGNMIHPDAPERIAKHIPGAKLIFILRNPIERAYSQYWYGIYRGTNSPLESFSDLIRKKSNNWGQRIIDLGMYYEQILRFEKYFDSSQLMIILYEDFCKNKTKVMNRIYKFINVEPTFVAANLDLKQNTTNYPAYYQLYRLLYSVWLPLEKKLTSSSLHFIIKKTHTIRSSIRNIFYKKNNQSIPKMKLEDRYFLQEIYQQSNKLLAQKLAVDLSHWQ